MAEEKKRLQADEGDKPFVKRVGKSEFSLLDLSEEILLRIFYHLDSSSLLNGVSLVCKKFNKLAFDESLWKTVSLNNLIGRRDIRKVLNKFPQVQNLTIRNGFISSKFFSELSRLTCLRSLSISSCNHACNWKCMELCDDNSPVSDSKDGKYYISNNSELKYVKCLQFEDVYLLKKNFTIFLKKCCRVEEISLGTRSFLIYKNLFAVTNSIFSITCKTLKRFHAEYMIYDDCFPDLNKCYKLTELHLSQCGLLTDETLFRIMKLPKLTELRLQNGERFSSFGIRKMFSEGKLFNIITLELVSFENLYDLNLEIIADHCQKLQNFHLSFCRNVTDSGISFIVRKCTQLTHLCLVRLNKIRGHFLSDIKKEILINLQCLILDEKLYNSDHALVHIKARPELDSVTWSMSANLLDSINIYYDSS